MIAQSFNSFVDLIILDRGIYQHPNVVETESDDLNGILQSQRIPNQHQLVQESEDEYCKVRRDCLNEGDRFKTVDQALLEFRVEI